MLRAVLEVRDLSVSNGRRRIVEAVSFDAKAGEIVAVIGPNGAGKTTLLEAIVGVRPAPPGVYVRRDAVGSIRERADAFAFAPDDALPPAEALVDVLVRDAESHRARAPATLERLATELGLGPLLRRPAGALSRGETKRVLLYLALAAARPVVVLDEPFAPFDPLQLRDVCRAVRLVAEEGSAVLVSIHQLALVERIADRVVLMAGGRRLAFGSVEDIRREAGNASSLEDAFIVLLSRTGERA